MSTDVGRCASCDQVSGGRPLCASCDARARSSYVYLSGDGHGNYEEGLFELLERLEPQSFWFRSRNQVIVWAVRTYLGGATHFLEVGCGTGFVLAALHERVPRLQVMGADLYAEGLDVARRRLSGVPLVQMSALEIPFSGELRRGRGASTCWSTSRRTRRRSGRCAERSGRGGGIVITVPQHPRLWSAADDFAAHVRRYDRGRADSAKVRRPAWEPVRVTSFVPCRFLSCAVSRASARADSDAYDLESELTLPKPVGPRPGGVLMTVERVTADARASLPGRCVAAGGRRRDGMTELPFNRPHIDRPRARVRRARRSPEVISPATGRSADALLPLARAQTGARRALLTHSCTAALEMAAILADVGPGDEVIMPSFTFVSTANAVRAARRRARSSSTSARTRSTSTSARIEAAITPRTTAIVPVALRGRRAARWTRSRELAAARTTCSCIEDAAQALMATLPAAGRSESSAHLGAISFHETKNVHRAARAARCSSTTERYVERAEIIREKGTNRSQFFRGQVDKYTWVDIGSLVPPERHHRGVPLRAARAGGRDHRAAARALERVPRRRSRRWSDAGACAGPSSRRLRHNAPHVLRAASRRDDARDGLIAQPRSRRRQGRVPLRPAALARRPDGERVGSSGPWPSRTT